MLQDTTAALTAQPNACELAVRVAHATETTGLLDGATEAWHREAATGTLGDLLLSLHHANFTLWHLEDSARDPAATAEAIAATKRAIDRVNQHRNDSAEAIDACLLVELAKSSMPRGDAPLHSETPGQILDRLSILSLKRFHTAEESRRPSASAAHRERNVARLLLLEEQSHDLAMCLQLLWAAVARGERRFKQYRQFKMYNDPDLNPVLYQAGEVG